MPLIQWMGQPQILGAYLGVSPSWMAGLLWPVYHASSKWHTDCLCVATTGSVLRCCSNGNHSLNIPHGAALQQSNWWRMTVGGLKHCHLLCLFQMLHVVVLSTFCTRLIVMWCAIPFSHTPDTGAASVVYAHPCSCR